MKKDKKLYKILENQVSFPVGAESDRFTAALASALVIARGYTEESHIGARRIDAIAFIAVPAAKTDEMN